jgi:hypothetical protein
MRSKEMIKETIKKVNNSLRDKNKPARRSVMTNAIDTTEERIATVAQENVQTQKPEMSKAEICFGAIMAIAAIAGMWGVVSLLISLFLN